MERFELPTIIESGGHRHMLERYLGEGAFGQVYACRHDDGRTVAAKRIDQSHPALVEHGSFLYELLAMHWRWQVGAERPPLVRWEGYLLTEEAWLETELCDGDLRSCLQRADYDGRRWFKPVARGVLLGLGELHLDGEAHADVHAGNLFFVGDPDQGPEALTFKLGDFSFVWNWHMAGKEYPQDVVPAIAEDLAQAARMLIQVWHGLEDLPLPGDAAAHLAVMPARQQRVLRAALDHEFAHGFTADTDFLYSLFPEDCPPGAVLTLDLRAPAD
jgi:serine/threonine protein kinase